MKVNQENISEIVLCDGEIKLYGGLRLMNWAGNVGLKEDDAEDDVMVRLWHDAMYEWMLSEEMNDEFNVHDMMREMVEGIIYCLQDDLKNKFEWATGIYTSNLLNILHNNSSFTAENEECIYVFISKLYDDLTRYVENKMAREEKNEMRRHIRNLFRISCYGNHKNKNFELTHNIEATSSLFAKRKYIKSYGQSFQKYTKNWNIKFKCHKKRIHNIYPYFSMSNEWYDQITEYLTIALDNTSFLVDTRLIMIWFKKCFDYGFNDIENIISGFDEYIWKHRHLNNINFISERIDMEGLIYDGCSRDEAEEYMMIDEKLKTENPKKYQDLIDEEYEFYESARINLAYIDRKNKFINTIAMYQI